MATVLTFHFQMRTNAYLNRGKKRDTTGETQASDNLVKFIKRMVDISME